MAEFEEVKEVDLVGDSGTITDEVQHDETAEVQQEVERRYTLAKESQGDSAVLMEGVLWKRGAVFKTWKKRWFSMVGNTISYFDKKDGNVKGGILVETILKVRKATSSEVKQPYSFAIETTLNRTFLIYARNNDHVQDWMQCIRTAVDKCAVETPSSEPTNPPVADMPTQEDKDSSSSATTQPQSLTSLTGDKELTIPAAQDVSNSDSPTININICTTDINTTDTTTTSTTATATTTTAAVDTPTIADTENPVSPIESDTFPISPLPPPTPTPPPTIEDHTGQKQPEVEPVITQDSTTVTKKTSRAPLKSMNEFWEEFHQSYLEQDVATILHHYVESSTVTCVDHVTNVTKTYTGLTSDDGTDIRSFYVDFFKTLSDLTFYSTPGVEITENPNQAIMAWKCPSSNVISGSDTIVFDESFNVVRHITAYTTVQPSADVVDPFASRT
eukprot:m.24464 g.24464  ORF g.24464 m.24464 type:complete len:445 (+) comp14615_c0_seq1:107-1441(+)